MSMSTPSLRSIRTIRARTSIRIRKLSTNAQPQARLRFAPSPTGYLHLGGLRTALFNHLYARALGGKWILRIEDTDQTRLVRGSVAALQQTLEWAKLEYDEGPSARGGCGPYVQSQRLDLYREYAERLVREGKAYRDFRAEMVASDAQKKGKAVALRDGYIAPTEHEARHLVSIGKKYVVRLRAPSTALDHHDLVYGDMHFPADPNRYGTEDPILLKSSGWPTYHLANVVDDHEMGITHVLRGEEWLPSLPKHIWLYRALGLEPPEFAHLPLLVNADGTKLSKRTGDVKVESYRDRGVEPEALNNFLGLMGYNNLAYHQGGEKEGGRGMGEHDEKALDVLTMDEMIRGFDIGNVNRSRATVDLSKLYYLNSRHVALKLDDRSAGGGREELIAKLQPRLVEAYREIAQLAQDRQMVEDVLVLTKGISATLYDVVVNAEPLLRRPDFSSPSARELFASNALVHTHFTAAVKHAHLQLSKLDQWSLESIHSVLSSLPTLVSANTQPPMRAQNKLKKAAILAPLRFALTASIQGAPLANLLLFLGQHQSLLRLQSALTSPPQP